MKTRLMRGDCLETLRRLPDQSVDLVVADLPYGVTACRWDTTIPLDRLWHELNRVMKPTKAAVFTATQPFTTDLIQSNRKNFKYCWVWLKTKPSGYQIAKVKPLNITEDIVVFGKGRITYNPQMIPREKPRTGVVHSTNRQMIVSGGGVYREKKTYTHKYPTTIIQIANGSQKDKVHPAQKPVELMEYLIRTYTNKGDVVLDPVMGSGTTGIACKRLRRSFIGIEKDRGYYEMAKKRIRAVSTR